MKAFIRNILGMLAILLIGQPVLGAAFGEINSAQVTAYYGDGSKAATFLKDDMVIIEELYNNKAQYGIRLNGKIAFIAQQQVDVTKVEAQTIPRAILREKPSRNAKVMYHLQTLVPVEVYARTGIWYEVKLPSGEVGYVTENQFRDNRYLQIVPTKKAKAVEVITWNEANLLIPRGTVITVEDVKTGKTFQIKRTFGTNHADVEAYTQADTMTIKSLTGAFTWERRPVIVHLGDRRLAASLSPMPHAGDSLNAVATNGMYGVMDLHFKGSRRHREPGILDVEDPQHQAAIAIAAQY